MGASVRGGFGALAAAMIGPLLFCSDNGGAAGIGGGEADFRAAREALVREVKRQVAQIGETLGTDGFDPAVIEAIGEVPRHTFVPPGLRHQAYRDSPLPIGEGQTISQPAVVAMMTHLLEVDAGDRVFELGTGSGYQAAVLAEMGVEVFSVEIVPALAERAASTLADLGYEQVHVRTGDGYLGWPEAAPFDGVIVTAGADHVPQPLLDQLAAGGRLVMPVGPPGRVQQLITVDKQADGSTVRREILPVRFVPVTGEHVR